MRAGVRSTAVTALRLGAAFVFLALAASCVKQVVVAHPPVRAADDSPFPASPSQIGASISVPYDTLQAGLNGQAPTQYDGNGRQNVCVDVNEQVKQTVQKVIGGDVGKFFGSVAKIITQVVTVNQVRHICQDVDYRFSIKRSGPIVVSPIPTGLKISVPVSADGVAGFSGDVAKVLALDKKNFRGSIQATADTSVDFGSDWCPTVHVAPSFVWKDKAQLEVTHNFWINIDSPAGDQINKMMNDEAAKLPSLIDCTQIRAAVLPLLQPHTLDINTMPPDKIYVHLVPQTVGFSGLRYDADALRLAVQVSGLSEISTSDAPAAALTTLPPLQRIPVTADTVNIAVPLKLGYDELSGQLTHALVGRKFTSNTQAGAVSVTIRGVEIYPSHKDLVVGLKFSAKLPGKVFDVGGEVYGIAEPSFDAASQRFSIKNFRFDPEIDNVIWVALAHVFQGQIQREVEKVATYDLSGPISLARAKLSEELVKLNKDPPHINAKISANKLGLEKIALTSKDLELLTVFQGTADVSVPITAIPAK